MVLRHRLLGQITRHRQSITGPILKPAEEIKQHLLTNERLRAFMSSWARRRSMSIPQVQREALQYVEEIAARPNPFMVKLGMGAVRWMLDNMFEGLDFNPDGFNAVRRASRHGPLILIPCHKSHVDYLVIFLSHAAQQSALPPYLCGRQSRVLAHGSHLPAGGGLFRAPLVQRRCFLRQSVFRIHPHAPGTRLQHRGLYRGHPQPQRQAVAAEIGDVVNSPQRDPERSLSPCDLRADLYRLRPGSRDRCLCPGGGRGAARSRRVSGR